MWWKKKFFSSIILIDYLLFRESILKRWKIEEKFSPPLNLIRLDSPIIIQPSDCHAFCCLHSSFIWKYDEFHGDRKVCLPAYWIYVLILKNILNGELIWRKERKNHSFLKFDFFLNEIIERMNSLKVQKKLIHLKKIEHHFSEFYITTRSMTQIDQQLQIKILLNIIILIFTHTIIHIFLTFDILKASMRRTITPNCVLVTQQIEEISVSKSHWFIVFNHWILTS